MTVKQLIEELSKIEDQDLRVMTSGYEGGFNDLETKTNNIQFMALDVNDEWYYGKHEPVDNLYDAPNSNYQIVKAIIL
jgi:hypothetical protein